MSLFNNLIERLKTNLFFKQILTLSSGNALSYTFGFIAIPMLARLYSKEAFDVLALYTSVISISGVTTTMQYDQALVRAQNDDDAISLARWAIFSSLIFSFIIFGVGLFTIDYFQPKYPWFNWLFILGTSIGGLVTALHQTAMQYMNRIQAYTQMRNVKVGFTAITLVFQMASFSIFPLFGMMTGQWSGKLVGSITILKRLFAKVFDPKKEPESNPKTWKQLYFENINFQRYQLPAVLIDRIAAEIPTLLLAAYFASHLADFSVAMRIIFIPVSIMTVAYSQVFYRRSSELVRENKPTRPFLVKTWLLMSAFIIVPVTLLFLFGEQIVPWVLGENWVSAGILLSLLAPLTAFIFVGSSTSTIYLALNKQFVSLGITILSLTYKFCIFYFGYHYLDFIQTIKLYVLVDSVAICFNMCLMYYHSR